MPAPSLAPAAPGLRPDLAWLANLIAFQLGWWVMVISAAWGRPELGLVVVALLVAAHLVWVRPVRGEIRLLALTGLIGFTLDSLLLASGWVSFTGGALLQHFAPLWMVALWVNFATLLNLSLRPLHRRPWLAAGLGGVGGPLAYWGGAELGAMSLIHRPAALITLALAWALLTPLLLALAGRISGRSPA